LTGSLEGAMVGLDVGGALFGRFVGKSKDVLEGPAVAGAMLGF
jgi:hypothetical protein